MLTEGYLVLLPDRYDRELPHNKFGDEEVEQAMAMMYYLDFGKPMTTEGQHVLDHWIEAVTNITVPVYLFKGGADPFIPLEWIRQIEVRFEELVTVLESYLWVL